MPPGRFGAVLQFLHGHLRRPKDGVLAVVELPIAGEQTPFGFKALVEWRVRKGRHDGEAGQIDSRLHRELRSLQEHIRFVVVEPEDETALERDAMFVQAFDDPAEFVRRIESFAALAEVFGRDADAGVGNADLGRVGRQVFADFDTNAAETRCCPALI